VTRDVTCEPTRRQVEWRREHQHMRIRRDASRALPGDGHVCAVARGAARLPPDGCSARPSSRSMSSGSNSGRVRRYECSEDTAPGLGDLAIQVDHHRDRALERAVTRAHRQVPPLGCGANHDVVRYTTLTLEGCNADHAQLPGLLGLGCSISARRISSIPRSSSGDTSRCTPCASSSQRFDRRLTCGDCAA
jgi:hypothetical protein